MPFGDPRRQPYRCVPHAGGEPEHLFVRKSRRRTVDLERQLNGALPSICVAVDRHVSWPKSGVACGSADVTINGRSDDGVAVWTAIILIVSSYSTTDTA